MKNTALWNGVLAQLGERYTGSVEVSGSIPLCSTTSYKSEPCAVRRWVRIYFYRPEIYPISAIKRDGLFYGMLDIGQSLYGLEHLCAPLIEINAYKKKGQGEDSSPCPFLCINPASWLRLFPIRRDAKEGCPIACVSSSICTGYRGYQKLLYTDKIWKYNN